jgi:hypothetical protein
MTEFYRFLPSKFYRSYNVVRPLSGLKQTKDGKLNFLEENQAVYHWAAELNSPFLYRRANDGVSQWNAYGILDGFLAAGTREISDTQKRRNAIRETYEEVCRFMRYYHGLAKKTERSGQ